MWQVIPSGVPLWVGLGVTGLAVWLRLRYGNNARLLLDTFILLALAFVIMALWLHR